MPTIIRSTRTCPNTPCVLFALEEVGQPYERAVVEDGWFTERFGVPGPALEEAGLVVVELGAVLRHIARAYGGGTLLPAGLWGLAEMDRWLDFLLRRIGRALDNPAELGRLFGVLDRQLEGRDFVVGEFSIVDCLYAWMTAPALRGRIPLASAPRVAGYLDRLAARPAIARAFAATT